MGATIGRPHVVTCEIVLSVDFLDQRLENRQTLLDHLIAYTVADPEVFRTAEAGTGNNQQILLLGQF